MSKVLPGIDADLAAWLAAQQLFFVGSAPLSGAGHVNISPKGGDSFRVLGEHEVAYCDYTGSGIETAAHLRENGRLVIMFCAFAGAPRIVRLHGRGRVLLPGSPGFAALIERFPASASTRLVVTLEVTRIASSCGYGVPFYEFRGPRDTMERWARPRDPRAWLSTGPRRTGRASTVYRGSEPEKTKAALANATTATRRACAASVMGNR